MKWVLSGWGALALILATSVAKLEAQDGDGSRPFCPEGSDACVDDSLEVVFPLFGAIDDSVFEYKSFVQGTRFDAGVVLDAKSQGEGGAGVIQGWSYGVTHDAQILTLVADSVTDNLPDVDSVFNSGFRTTAAVDGGFISGIVLSFAAPAVLPPKRNFVARASYTMQADAGEAGTKLEMSSGVIGPPNSPATEINITIGGRAKLPRTVKDGIVRRLAAGAPEICTNGLDDDGDSLIDMADPECFDCPCPEPGGCEDFAFYFGGNTTVGIVDARAADSFVISGRNARPLLGFQFGVKLTEEGGDVNYAFSGELGTDAERLIEILMTDNQGESIQPLTPNSLVASSASLVGIERGSALAGFSGGDFLEFDLSPGVGGPGFFVGYVSDLDGNVNQIPVTGSGDGRSCPLNELLVVRIGAPACPGFAFYFGDQVTTEAHDARGQSSISISARNSTALLGFQFGVRTAAGEGGTTYELVDDIGTDAERLVEIIMTDLQGNSISPATPNTAISDTVPILDVVRGAAIAGFAGGDFFQFDLAPGVGGPGFFVGYVSDLDGNVNQIPATTDAECTTLNEVVRINLEEGGIVCPDFGLLFGSEPVGGTVDAGGAGSFVLSSRNGSPLLAFQLGVRISPDADRFRYAFANDLGTDNERLVEVLMTDTNGDSITPMLINDLIASSGQVASIERGSAIAGFAGGDFLEFDLEPGVGGPGFFVGYVSDLDGNVNQIPATAPREGDTCPLNELLLVRLGGGGVACPDYGLLFGSEPVSGTVDIGDAETWVISGRNAAPLLGLQLGVTIRPDGENAFRFAFSDALGTDNDRLVECLMTDNEGNSITPEKSNELLALNGTVGSIERGAAIAGFAGGDFFDFDLEPGVGGPGFFLGYVSDLDGNVNQIPGTGPREGDTCALNELFIVNVAADGDQPFSRGDADGNGRVNISDAVIVIQEIVLNFSPPRFDCADMRDVDDNGELNIADGLPILIYIFQEGPEVAPPFRTCAVDPTEDALDCRQSNCRPEV